MNEFILQSPYFGVMLCLASYFIGDKLCRHFKKSWLHPLPIAIILCMTVLVIFRIEYQTFRTSANLLNWMLTPATAALAIPLYEQITLLRRHAGAIFVSIVLGVVTSMVTVLAVRLVCSLDAMEYATFLTKSVTTPIGMPIARELGGYEGMAAIAIVLTGVAGNVMAPSLLKRLKIEEPIAKGLAIGTCSHAVGTTRALEMGEIEGAMSSLAIVVSGLVTVVLAPAFNLI